MSEEKMALEEFKDCVVQLLVSVYAPAREQEFLRACVEDVYFRSEIEDGYDHRLGIEYGIRYAAENISMCI